MLRFAELYTKHFAAQCGRRLDGLSPEAVNCIRAYSWPGNLRELRNAIERAVIMARGGKLFPEDFSTELRGHNAATNGANGESLPQIGAFISLEKVEEAHLRKILERASSLSQAAEILGIDQATSTANAKNRPGVNRPDFTLVTTDAAGLRERDPNPCRIAPERA